VPGLLSPFQITVKGAAAARRLLRNRRPLTVLLHGKTIGTYRLDGAVRARRTYVCGKRTPVLAPGEDMWMRTRSGGHRLLVSRCDAGDRAGYAIRTGDRPSAHGGRIVRRPLYVPGWDSTAG
jgi:hypothetical protein